MTGQDLVITHEVDLSPSIVWDALVDPELLAGWIGESAVDARAGGSVSVRLVDRGSESLNSGSIQSYVEGELISVVSEAGGFVEIRLEAVPGGSRGTATLLHLRVRSAVEIAIGGGLRERWNRRLSHLDELLAGHPVDWSATADAAVNETAPTQHPAPIGL